MGFQQILGRAEKAGRLNFFSLGTHDASDRLWILRGCTVATQEVKLLLDAFERVVTAEACEAIRRIILDGNRAGDVISRMRPWVWR
jgi:hypothetical protein